MARDLPYVGVTLSEQVQPNSVWYKRLLTRANTGFYSVTQPSSFFTSIGARTYSFRTRRGRTYELGRIESGECNLTVDNSDSYFDPASGHSKLFRPLTITAAYPTTGNILNDTNLQEAVPLNAPNGSNFLRISVGANDGNFELGAISNWYWDTGNAPTASSTRAYAGTYSMKIGGSVTLGKNLLDVPVVANKQITISFYYSSTTSQNLSWSYWNGGYNSYTATSTGNVTANTTWQRQTITVTPSGQKITIGLQGSSTTVPVYIDNVQVEFGSSASTYTATGPRIYNLFNGFVERYPQSYQAPNRGEVNMVATDALASLSQVVMPSLYETYTLSNGVNLYYYPLSEPEGSGGSYNKSPYNQSPLLPVSIGGSSLAAFATPVYGVTTAQTAILGAGTTGCNVSGLQSPSGYFQGSYLTNNQINDILFNVGDIYTFSLWVKSPAATTNDAYIGINALSGANRTAFIVRQGASGAIQVGAPIAGAFNSTAVHVLDPGTVGFLALQVTRTNSTTYTATVTVNGGNATSVTWTNSNDLVINDVVVGGPSTSAYTYNATNSTTIAHFAIHRGIINSYNFWAVGVYAQLSDTDTPEQTGTRFANTLSSLSGFPYLPYLTDLGRSQMSPLNTTNIPVSDYLQAIADTEGGVWFVDGQGYLVFRDRLNRLNKLVPKLTFGDGSGEVPYEGEGLVINYDPTYVLNSIAITRSGGTSVVAQDASSISDYYPRSYNATLYNGSDAETADAVYYLLAKYKDPHARPETITLTPARNPAIWAQALGLEIGDFVRVKKRPIGGTAISVDCFVERVEHNFDAQSGDWVTHVTLSPQLGYYWNLAALRATSNGAGSAGSIRLTKASNRTTGGIVSINDIKQGTSLLVQWTDSAGVTYVGATRPSLCTDASGYVVLSAQAIGYFSTGSSTLANSYATINQTISADYLGTLTLDGVGLNSNAGMAVWLNGELITVSGTGTGSTLTITARGVNGTTPQPHYSGETLYSLDSANFSNPPNGTVLSEFLAGNTPYSNQFTRRPYAVGTYNGYDAVSVLGSWNNSLASGSYNVVYPTSSSYPSVLAYNQFTISPLTDFQNYPVNDLAPGQILTIQSTDEVFGVVNTGSPDSSTGVWALSAYSLIPTSIYNRVLASDVSMDATTITATTNFPTNFYAVLINGEFMSVTSGTGTATLTVVRGTPDLLAWGKLGQSRHYAGDQVYIVGQNGSIGTFASGDAVIEGDTATIVTGTTKLGY